MKSESCFQICMSLVTFLTMHVCCNTVSFIVNWEKRFLPRGMITMIFLTLTNVKMNFLSKHMQFLKIYNFESNWCVLTLAAKWISFNTFKSGNFYFLIMRLNSLRKKKRGKRYVSTDVWVFLAVSGPNWEQIFTGTKLKYKIYFPVVLMKNYGFPLASVQNLNLVWDFKERLLKLILFSWKLFTKFITWKAMMLLTGNLHILSAIWWNVVSFSLFCAILYAV